MAVAHLSAQLPLLARTYELQGIKRLLDESRAELMGRIQQAGSQVGGWVGG